eukprot:TRINITY_DN138410_c0_g1_i1.p2 TRINITY_DN138410_c0_g1~~TRINITY_DN138410_c0_g1_i1.p2  ORF type:complete len:180 (-),score=25.76 TRINITY_DN138410_c0_g1_i1:425-931(-)
MSLIEKLKAKYKDELLRTPEITELILDGLCKVDSLIEKDQQFLEKFYNLSYLSMNSLGLTSLKYLPRMSSIIYAFFLPIKQSQLELNDNNIATGLAPLKPMALLKRLSMEGNKIATFKDLEPLVPFQENMLIERHEKSAEAFFGQVSGGRSSKLQGRAFQAYTAADGT